MGCASGDASVAFPLRLLHSMICRLLQPLRCEWMSWLILEHQSIVETPWLSLALSCEREPIVRKGLLVQALFAGGNQIRIHTDSLFLRHLSDLLFHRPLPVVSADRRRTFPRRYPANFRRMAAIFVAIRYSFFWRLERFRSPSSLARCTGTT